MSSKKKEAKEFKKFVTHTILPSIRRTGNYISNQSNIASSSNEPVIKSREITYFYDENDITPYLNLNVIYVGETGEFITMNGEEKKVFKLGKSYRAIDRDFKEHRKTFVNFKMIHIIHCDNNDVVEDYLKIELKAKDMLCELTKKTKKNEIESDDIKKQKHTETLSQQNLHADSDGIILSQKQMALKKPSVFNETFILTDKFDLNYVVDLIKRLVDENPLKGIKERDDIIKELKKNNDFELQKMNMELKIKQEETKQLKIKLKIMQIKHKIKNDESINDEDEMSETEDEK